MTKRRIAIFGPGRVGASFAAYARSLGHAARLISRAETEACEDGPAGLIGDADVVAVAVPDDRLAAFAEVAAPGLSGRVAIHFSGALRVEGLWSYHPLYSFPRSALTPARMAEIAFAREETAPSFGEILPGAANPEFVVRDADRARYHALAVLSGNFAAHLWNLAARDFSDRLDAPPELLAGYFRSLIERFAESPFDSLTGPAARRDRASVEANLAALSDRPDLQALYRAFLASAWPDF